MQPHTVRRTAVAFLAAAFLAGLFAVAQPAGAQASFDVTIESGSFMEVTGADGTTTTTFTMGDPACDNGQDDDSDTATDFPADNECVNANDNTECNAANTPFVQPTYEITENPSLPDVQAHDFVFPMYEMGLGAICVDVELTATEPVDGFYDLDHSESGADLARALQELEFTVSFDIALTGDSCSLGPVGAIVDSNNSGGVDLSSPPLPQTATMTVQNVTVPAVQSSGTCSPAIAGAINANLGGMPGTADAVLNITVS